MSAAPLDGRAAADHTFCEHRISGAGGRSAQLSRAIGAARLCGLPRLRLPSIGSLAADLDAADPAATARFRLVRRFGYEDFKTRLS